MIRDIRVAVVVVPVGLEELHLLLLQSVLTGVASVKCGRCRGRAILRRMSSVRVGVRGVRSVRPVGSGLGVRRVRAVRGVRGCERGRLGVYGRVVRWVSGVGVVENRREVVVGVTRVSRVSGMTGVTNKGGRHALLLIGDCR